MTTIARRFVIQGVLCALAATLDGQDSVAVRAPSVASTSGMVVCSSGIACDAGARILASGGNAVDAAVATAFALAVTYPSAGNLGGGGFMLVRTPRGVNALDFRERAPQASTATMYLDSASNIDRRLTATGHLAVGVPGTVRGLELAHRKYGRLRWRDVVAPAIQLAEQGFVLSDALARSLNREVERGMTPYPASVAAYGRPGGGEWVAGETIRLADLARSLKAIASGGADAFYKGWIADSIAAEMARSSGLITKKDLAAYRAKERKPIHGTFHGNDVYSMPPPSSGGVALVEMLNVLEAMDLTADDRWSPRTLHVTIEAMRRAYHDRAQYLGDPDFVKMPSTRLTSKDYAQALAKGIDSDRATSSLTLEPKLVTIADGESEETTHISVVDPSGMAVSMTYTLEGGFGSHVVARGTGILLNNEMGDFNKKPGYTSLGGDIGTDPNLIAPGKRMLSSMSPTIVTKGGELVLVTGSPGGRTIINTVLGVVVGAIGYGADARAAVDAPRLHHQWLPDTVTFEEGAIPDSTVARLQAMGHNVRLRGRQGDAHTIRFESGTRTAHGANDLRSPDSKVSVP